MQLLSSIPLTVFTIGLFIMALPGHALPPDEQTFASPQAAVDALVAAATSHDKPALRRIFGEEGHALVSPDPAQAGDELNLLDRRLKEKVHLFTHTDSSMTLDIGTDAWPFPIPLVKQDGKWFFDTVAGAREILGRRITRDELRAIDFCKSYATAQRLYASEDRMGDGVMAYAQLLQSTPGKHDGLYWVPSKDETPSPLGTLLSDTHEPKAERHDPSLGKLDDGQTPYHGYYLKILTAQESSVPGGAYSYVINGRMIAGFALIAWPAEWGKTGVLSFMVNQQGKIWQKDLGTSTSTVAGTTKTYGPDATWTPVNDGQLLLAERPGDVPPSKSGSVPGNSPIPK